MDAKPLRIRFNKIDGFIYLLELDIWYCLEANNIISFDTELDIL